jgi:hypothetical protein
MVDDRSHQLIVAQLSSGQLFGESACLFDPATSTAATPGSQCGVQSLSRVECLVIHRDHFLQCVKASTLAQMRARVGMQKEFRLARIQELTEKLRLLSTDSPPPTQRSAQPSYELSALASAAQSVRPLPATRAMASDKVAALRQAIGPAVVHPSAVAYPSAATAAALHTLSHSLRKPHARIPSVPMRAPRPFTAAAAPSAASYSAASSNPVSAPATGAALNEHSHLHAFTQHHPLLHPVFPDKRIISISQLLDLMPHPPFKPMKSPTEVTAESILSPHTRSIEHGTESILNLFRPESVRGAKDFRIPPPQSRS